MAASGCQNDRFFTKKGIIMAAVKKKIDLGDVLDASTNGVIVTNDTGIVVYVNQLARNYFHRKKNAILNSPVENLIPAIKESVRECIRHRKKVIGLPLAENKLRAVANISPIIKRNKIIGTSISIKSMEEYEGLALKLDAYRKQNILLKAIFNASTDGLWIMDPGGVIVDWNPAAEDITGYKAEEMIGKVFKELESIGISQEDVHYISEAMETKRRVSTFNTHPRSGKQVLGNASPVLDEDQNLMWVVGNEHDLSELNTLREELEDALKITEKAKDELSGLDFAELKDEGFVAESKAMLNVFSIANKLAKTAASHILITGESGTGKGFLSKFIHKRSGQAAQPFIQINCAAVPENLLEAELFGYEKGAFTGAAEKGKAGLIELAHGGTLFLDEIGDMPIRLQAKLLKYLDDHEVLRLGSVKARKIECAIISATNQKLEKLVEKKRFRQDLLFRLNTFHIHIPPLRERGEDIFELVQLYIRQYNKKYKRRKRISAEGIDILQAYSFPGNVRELKSLCKQAVLMSEDRLLDGYFAHNLNMVCAPVSLSEPTYSQTDTGENKVEVKTSDPLAVMASWIANMLKSQSHGNKADDENVAIHPTVSLALEKVVDLARLVLMETNRRSNASQPSESQPKEPLHDIPLPGHSGDDAPISLNEALNFHERKIFLQAMKYCNTIRELAEYLQTSPATALRKLKKHGLSL